MSIDEMFDPKVSQKHFKTYAEDSLHLIKLLSKHITELEIKVSSLETRIDRLEKKGEKIE